MKRKKTTAAICALAAVAAQPAQALALDITSGHMDLDFDYAGGLLTMDWRTYSPMSAGTPTGNDDYGIAGNAVIVPLANSFVVSGSSSFACLGSAGSTMYRLKQQEDAGQVWLGWNSNDIPASTFVGDKVTLKLKSVVSAPPGGRFVLYTTNGFGTPTYLLNSTGGACNKASWDVPRLTHLHGWWAFSAPGTYTVRLEVTGTLTGGAVKSSGDVDVTFKVQ
jgi:surface-anchored protein